METEWQTQFARSGNVICVIAADDTIVYCNPAWDANALKNNGASACAINVMGKSLFSFIPFVLEDCYRRMVEITRLERQVHGNDYECNSADQFSLFHVKMLPIPRTDLLAMVHSLRTENSPHHQALAPSPYHHGPGNIVTMCAQCRRTRSVHRQRWDWVPEFVNNPPPRVSHGICPECTIYLYA